MQPSQNHFTLPPSLKRNCELFLAPLPGYKSSPGLRIWPDISGNARDGVISGATWTLTPWGWGLSFDGVDDYAVCPLATSATDNFTLLSVTNLVTEWDSRFAIKNGGSEGGGAGFGPQRGRNKMLISSKEWNAGSLSLPSPVGKYQLQALIRENRSWKFNLNGNNSAVFSTTNMLAAPISSTTIGCRFITNASDARDFLKGIIAAAMVYSKPLSESEIKDLYKMLFGGRVIN
jgi:hypothetical protein